MKKAHPWVEAERKFYEKHYKSLTEQLDLSGDLTVLDYGGGTGGFASMLAEANPKLRVKVVDSNPEAVNLGKQHYSQLSNLEFEVSSDIPPGEYDIIFQNLVLHELDGADNKKAIAEHLRKSHDSLKPGGMIAILDNRRIPKRQFKGIYEHNQSRHKGSFDEEYQEHNRYTMRDWKKMIEAVGFETRHHEKLKPNLFKYHGRKRAQ